MNAKVRGSSSLDRGKKQGKENLVSSLRAIRFVESGAIQRKQAQKSLRKSGASLCKLLESPILLVVVG